MTHLPGFVTIISLPTELNIFHSSLSRRLTVIPCAGASATTLLLTDPLLVSISSGSVGHSLRGIRTTRTPGFCSVAGGLSRSDDSAESEGVSGTDGREEAAENPSKSIGLNRASLDVLLSEGEGVMPYSPTCG